MTIERIFVFPGMPIDPKVTDIIKNAEAGVEAEDLYLGNVDKMWVIDLKRGAMYILSHEEQKLLRLKPIVVLSEKVTK